MRNPFFLTVIRIAIPAPPTAASCGGGTSGIIRNRNHSPQIARIKTATGLVTRIAIRITMGNVTSPGRGTSDMVQTDPADALHDTETTTMSAAVPTSADVHAGMTVASTTAKQSNGAGPVPAPRGRRWAHTPERRPLLPPPMLHSTPLAASLKPPSVESVLQGYLSTAANAHFLPWNWGRKTLVPFLPWASLSRQLLHPWPAPYHYFPHHLCPKPDSRSHQDHFQPLHPPHHNFCIQTSCHATFPYHKLCLSCITFNPFQTDLIPYTNVPYSNLKTKYYL